MYFDCVFVRVRAREVQREDEKDRFFFEGRSEHICIRVHTAECFWNHARARQVQGEKTWEFLGGENEQLWLLSVESLRKQCKQVLARRATACVLDLHRECVWPRFASRGHWRAAVRAPYCATPCERAATPLRVD